MLAEELEVSQWLRGTEFRFADDDIDDADGEWSHPSWVCWAVPLSLIFSEYTRWKRGHIYRNSYDDDVPQLITSPRAFGVCLRTLYPDLDDEGQEWSRRVAHKYKRPNGKRSSRLVYRGIKHPDAIYIGAYPGRRPHDYIVPIIEEG